MSGALLRSVGRTAAGGGGATDPDFASVVLLSGFEGADASTTFTDESTIARTLTANGNAQIDTAQAKFGSSSLLLDGTGDYVSAADSADWNFGTAPFTMEAWVRKSDADTDWCVFSQWSASGAPDSAWALFATGGSLYFRFTNTGSTLDATGAFAPSAGTWYHIAADRDAAHKFRLYVDGVMIGSYSPGGATALSNSASALRIGSVEGFAQFDLAGWTDEARITKGVARYASDGGFPVPTAAFPRS